ncbi:uncharacterized protein JCM15063_000112 [Sporobolomyces koalae]|uniref:uncharacterized protein n=1 Tax=Sporobolomyces koalae TaxID=500713 RepID=UPI00317D0572
MRLPVVEERAEDLEPLLESTLAITPPVLPSPSIMFPSSSPTQFEEPFDVIPHFPLPPIRRRVPTRKPPPIPLSLSRNNAQAGLPNTSSKVIDSSCPALSPSSPSSSVSSPISPISISEPVPLAQQTTFAIHPTLSSLEQKPIETLQEEQEDMIDPFKNHSTTTTTKTTKKNNLESFEVDDGKRAWNLPSPTQTRHFFDLQDLFESQYQLSTQPPRQPQQCSREQSRRTIEGGGRAATGGVKKRLVPRFLLDSRKREREL